jgi:CheY-like chemotaxis protein
MAITTHPQPGPRHRVLVVDDEPDIVYLVKHLLEGAGFDVHETTTGREAIELATRDCQHPFEVVVLDVTMPDIDGVSVAADLRASDGCRRTRIVFHTALDETHVRSRFAGYDGFLAKPVQSSELVDCVSRLAASAREH